MTHHTAAPTPAIPGAWYDLAVRIDAAQAVSSCALESLSCGSRSMDYARLNHTSNLIAATQDLLTLMAADAELIARQMKL